MACCAAWAKAPITHEAMWLMKRVGAPAPSPDGQWVAFPVTEPAYDEKDQVSDLWIVPAQPGAGALPSLHAGPPTRYHIPSRQ